MLEQYRKHVAERAAEGIVPKPLDAEQVAALVELIKQPPAGEEAFHPRPAGKPRSSRC